MVYVSTDLGSFGFLCFDIRIWGFGLCDLGDLSQDDSMTFGTNLDCGEFSILISKVIRGPLQD